MRPAAWMLLLRLLTVVAIGASAALFVDYANPIEASFCGPDSGCAKVQRSGFGYLGGYLGLPLPYALWINTPLVGLVGYGSVLFATYRSAHVARIMATIGGVLATVLVGVQLFVVGQLCWLCMLVDSSAIGIGAVALLHAKAEAEAEAETDGADVEPIVAGFTAPVLTVVVVLAAALWPSLKPAPPVPGTIRALYEPGKVNVVEFGDFQCPFCRKLHPLLSKLEEEYGDRVHVVRMNFPLEHHEQARFAARAYVCATQQDADAAGAGAGASAGVGEKMADLLFEAEDLDPASNRVLAERLGLDLGAYDACIDDPKTDTRIDTEMKVLEDAGLQGLPTTYIGGRRIVGVHSETAFRDAFESAASGEENRGVPAAVYWPMAVMLMGAVGALGRRRRRPAEG